MDHHLESALPLVPIRTTSGTCASSDESERHQPGKEHNAGCEEDTGRHITGQKRNTSLQLVAPCAGVGRGSRKRNRKLRRNDKARGPSDGDGKAGNRIEQIVVTYGDGAACLFFNRLCPSEAIQRVGAGLLLDNSCRRHCEPGVTRFTRGAQQNPDRRRCSSKTLEGKTAQFKVYREMIGLP